jgi:DNA processing protein
MFKMEVFDAPSHYYPSDAMSLDELAYWITFNRVSGIGPVSFKTLLEYFDNDLEAAWRAGTKELAQAGLTHKTIENVVNLRATSTPQRELEKLEKLRIRVITWKDKNYPPLFPTRSETPRIDPRGWKPCCHPAVTLVSVFQRCRRMHL